ncbi:hypothetical protein BRCH_04536c [Candidatus Burkholderia brachyanthoides]|nr:hypothetical protein BRCH_04536c [Candidatus Burkholderia brachyanthoides]
MGNPPPAIDRPAREPDPTRHRHSRWPGQHGGRNLGHLRSSSASWTPSRCSRIHRHPSSSGRPTRRAGGAHEAQNAQWRIASSTPATLAREAAFTAPRPIAHAQARRATNVRPTTSDHLGSAALVSEGIVTDQPETDLPQADGADPATVFTAAFGVLFKRHPNPALLLSEWEKIASQMPLMVLKNGAKNISHDAKRCHRAGAPAYRTRSGARQLTCVMGPDRSPHRRRKPRRER